MADGDQLLRGYAVLSALKANLPDQYGVTRWPSRLSTSSGGAAVAECPERVTGKLVKVWQPEVGWKDVLAAQAFPLAPR